MSYYDEPIYMGDTRFIYATNFAGDPEKDRFGNGDRKANIVIPTEEQAMYLKELGCNVKQVKPREGEEEGYVPTYFVPIKLGYKHPKKQPHVYLVTNGVKTELTEDQVGMLDDVYVMNVCATLNARENKDRGSVTLYVAQLYVEQEVADDPWAARYESRDELM